MRGLLSQARKKKIEENNLWSYMLFAIVELFIIVVGMFMAIQLDTKSKMIQDEESVTALLIEVQSNLSKDIILSNRIFNRYILDNRLLDLVYDSIITRDQIEELTYEIDQMNRFYVNYNLTDLGFQGLKASSEIIPNSYKDLFGEITAFYNSRLEHFKVYNERNQNTIYKYQDFLIEHQAWFNRDLHLDLKSEDQIDFYYRNPRVKSQMGLVMDDVHELYFITSDYRTQAVVLYNKINLALGDTAIIPNHVTIDCNDQALLDSFVGTYHWESGLKNKRVEKDIIVEASDAGFTIQLHGEQPKSLLYLTNSIFYFDKSYDLVLFNKDGRLEYINKGIQKDYIFRMVE
jgi:hypothetical protein